MLNRLFNDDDEENRFYKFIAQNNGGRVPIDVMGAEAGEIMKIIQEKSKDAKN